MEPAYNITPRTQLIRRPATVTELKTLVEFLPTTYLKPGDKDSKPWRFLRADVCKDPELDGWIVMSFMVLDTWDGKEVLLGSMSGIQTQRGKTKSYKSLDTLVADLKGIVGDCCITLQL